MRFRSHPTDISMCLLLSAPPPAGLDAVLNVTHRMDSSLSEELMRDMVHQSDVLFWVMSALRMFHGDFSPALEAAIRKSVPIWVGVTGVDAVADPDAFIQSAVAEVKTRLRGESEIFIFQRDGVGRELEKIGGILRTKSQLLADRGGARRYETLRASMLQRLAEFRRSVEADFGSLEKRLDTASHGLEAARIQLRSATGQVRELQIKIISLVDGWAQDMCTRIEAANDSRKLETVCQSIYQSNFILYFNLVL